MSRSKRILEMALQENVLFEMPDSLEPTQNTIDFEPLPQKSYHVMETLTATSCDPLLITSESSEILLCESESVFSNSTTDLRIIEHSCVRQPVDEIDVYLGENSNEVPQQLFPESEGSTCDIAPMTGSNENAPDPVFIPYEEDESAASETGFLANKILAIAGSSKDPDFIPYEPDDTAASKTRILTNKILPNAGSSKDPDFIPYESDESVASETENVSNKILPIATTSLRKRKKRRHVDQKTWCKNVNQLKKAKGEDYLGKKKEGDKWNYEVARPKRELKMRCNCKISKKNSKRRTLKCTEFTEEDRKQIFSKFWELSDAEKKIYINMLTIAETIKRPRDRKEDGSSRRQLSLIYCLKKKEEKLRVCKTMFLNTLSVGEWSVASWKKKTVKDEENEEVDVAVERQNESSQGKRREVFQRRKNSLVDFFNSLAKMESHYCRARTQKLYLEPIWRSKMHLYKVYSEKWCNEKDISPVSTALFSNIFDDMNLSIFVPKKDECSTCVARNTGNLNESEYELHQLKKTEARDEKSKDKQNEANKVYTVDLQSVLLTPKSNVSLLYYKKKLVVHNFTIYNIKTKQGFCYLWNECEGKIGANEFSTIISNFIEHEARDLKKNQELIFYSDGCCSQNRNATLANAILHASIVNNITVVQKYLERGHTQMEADSMHSLIERALKHRKINIPADYVDVCLQARSKPEPFQVKYLDHSFFKDFGKLNYLTSIRPGKKVGDSTVMDIRALRYNPSGIIEFKIRHPEEWQTLPVRINKTPKTFTPMLYNERLKLSKDKYEQLQQLKSCLEKDYHSFYDSLPHE